MPRTNGKARASSVKYMALEPIVNGDNCSATYALYRIRDAGVAVRVVDVVADLGSKSGSTSHQQQHAHRRRFPDPHLLVRLARQMLDPATG
jgi:6-phosphogluconolactonase (cycloisomerase 2 family)